MISSFDLILLGRAVLAIMLGFLVGWERKVSGSLARGRFVGLASLVSTVVTTLAVGLFPTLAGSFVPAVITGSGFLGAGLIINEGRGQVRGLATAAGLWAMIAVGVVIGIGHELLGIVLTLLIYLILAWDSWPLIARFRQRRAGQPAPQAASTPHVEAPSGRDLAPPDAAPDGDC